MDLKNSNTVTGASLVEVALSNLQASGLGFDASGGDIGIAVISAPGASSSTNYWFAVYGLDLSASLDLGSEITISSGSATVQVNTSENSASGGTAPPTLDWATDVTLTTNGPAYTVDPGQLLPTPVDLTISYASSVAASVSTSPNSGAGAKFNLAGLISGSADFAYSETTNVSVSFEGMSSQIDVSGATLYQVALSNLAINTAFGLDLNGSDIGIAAIVPPTSSTDSRYWVAVAASGLGGSLDLGGELSATVSGTSVALSLDGGKSGTTSAQNLNWAADIFEGSPLTLATINPGSLLSENLTISYSAPEPYVSVTGSLSSLNIFNVITGSANFSLVQSTVDVALNGQQSSNLVGATEMGFGLSSLELNLATSLGTGSVTTGTNGSLVIAAIVPANTAADSRSWVAVMGMGLTAAISLANGDVAASFTDLNVNINQASGTGPDGSAAAALNWAEDISTDGGTTYGGSSNELTISGQTITFATQQLSLSGALASVNVFNLISGSWTTNQPEFALSVSTINVEPTGTSSTVLTGATLVTIALANFDFSAGAGGFGVSITSGALGIAVVTWSGSGETAQWVAVDASGFGASLSLTSSVTAAISGVSVSINQASGTYLPAGDTSTPALNWNTDLDLADDNQYGTPADQVNPGDLLPTPISLPIDFAEQQFILAGTLANLNVFNVIEGSASFALSVSTEPSVTVGGSSITNATLYTLALANLSFGAGTGGFGLAITGGDLGIAVIEATGTGDSRYWIAAVGLNLAASLSLTSNITASVSSLTLNLNQYGGSDSSGPNTTPLDWTQFAPNYINPGANLQPTDNLQIEDTAQAQISLGGTLTGLNIFNLIQGSASFAISDISPWTFTPTGGTPITGGTLVTVGLYDIMASVGTGGFGLSISGGDLGIAILEPPAPSSGTDSRYWVAVDASGIGARLALGGISASVASLNVQVNEAGGTDTSNNPATELDWTQFTPRIDPGANIPSLPAGTLAINDNATSPQFQVGATGASFNIFNLFTGSANFTLSQSTTNVSFTGAAPASLVGATLVQVSLSDFTFSLGASGFGLTISSGTSGAIAVAAIHAPTPAQGSDNRYWVAVAADDLTATLSFGSSFTATVSSLSLEINQAGGSFVEGTTTTPATPLDWTQDLDLTGSGTFGGMSNEVNPGGVLSAPISYTGPELSISGTLQEINLFNLFSGSASFAITITTVNVAFSGMGKPDITGATLITVALSNLNIAVGAGGFGLAITGGDLGIAALSPPSSSGSSASWIAVDGMGLGATFSLGSSVTATVNSVTVQINQASGTWNSSPAMPLDWADDIDLTGNGTYAGQVNPGATLPTPVNLTISYTNGLLAVAGALADLNIFGILTGSADFAISISTVNVTTPALTGATLLTLALTNVNLTVGVGSVGLTISAGNLGIAAIMPPESASGDTASWIAVDADDLAAAIILGGFVTASVSDVSVQINQATGDVAAGQAASPLNWTQFNPAINPGSLLPQAAPPNLTITYTAGITAVSGNLTNLNIFNLIAGSAEFYIGITTINLPAADGPDSTGATLLTLALANLNLMVGTDGFGLSITGGNLGLAVITPGPIPTGTTATDNRMWIGAYGSIQTVSLGLGPDITAQASNVLVQVNQASGAYASGGTTTTASPLNWTTLPGAPINPGANLPSPVQLPITYTQSLLQVQASVVLSISSFVYIAGNVSFSMTGPLSVTPVGGGMPIQVNVLEIGASNVNVFVGTGGPYFNSNGTLASNSDGALGLALSDISLGLALLTPTAGGSTTYYALDASGSAQLVGVSGLTLAGSLAVEVNGSSSASTPVIDFSQLPGNSLAIPTGSTTAPINIGFSSPLLEVSGSLTLGISSFAFITGQFAFLQGPTQTVTLDNSTTETVSTLEVGVSNVYAFAGVNGPYWVMSGNGSIRGPTSTDAMGVAVSQASLGLALMKPVPTTGDSTPTVSYLALKATGSVALIGIPDITLSANNISVEVNEATDPNNPNPPAVNLAASNISIPTDTNPADNIPLNFASGAVLAAQGTVSLAISQFVSITGSVAFTKGTAQNLTLSDGTTLTGASMLTVGAGGVYAFAGVGGPYWMTGPGGSVEAPIGSSAVGVALGTVSFGLALVQSSTGSETFYALNASAASVALIGVPGLTLSATSLNLDVNGSSGVADNAVINFTASYPASGGGQPGLSVPTGPSSSVTIADTSAVVDASANVTLGIAFAGQPALSLTAMAIFEDTTDGNGAQSIALGLTNLDMSFGSLLSINDVDAYFLIDGSTVAGEISVPLSFYLPSQSNPTVSFDSMIMLEFNNGTNAIDTTFTYPGGDTYTLNLPAGPFVLFSGTSLNLTINAGSSPITLLGNLQIEEVTVPSTSGGAAQTEIRIAAYDVSLTYSDPSYGGVSLTNGQGAFIILQGGVAGQLSGDFSFTTPSMAPVVQAGGEIYLEINSTSSNVDQTIPLATGGSLQVDVNANTFAIGISNASINIGNIVTLTGNIQITNEPGMTLYGASNVTLFLGDGPPTINGAANPNAIGVEVTNASIGVVDINGNYAVFAYGQAQLVGLSPLSVSGSLAVWYNQTGQALDVTVPLPPGSTPASVPVVFQSTNNVEEFAAGYDSDGAVDPSQLLTISASQVFTIQGAVEFTLMPTGQVSVDIPTASVNITIPNSDGTFPSTPTFSISGSAQFMMGGSSGFQLQSLQVNGFSIFGVGATIQNPATSLLPPTATLVSPAAGQAINLTTLNNQGYIAVHYNDFNNSPINVASILNGSGQFTLSGPGIGTVVVNADPTQVNPNDDSDFDYHFTGDFAIPSGTSSTVTLSFTPGSFGDMAGATNVAQSATFTIYSTVTAPTMATASLANPANGQAVNPQSMDQRGYIDVNFNLPSGDTIAPGTLTGNEITLTLPSGSNILVNSAGNIEGLVNGQAQVVPPVLVAGNTYRYYLTPSGGMAMNQMFATGTVTVNFVATTLTVQTAGSSGTSTVSMTPSTESFTVSGSVNDEASSTGGITLGPLSLSGPSLGLAGESFSGGTLDLTVAIGVASASLSFGGGQSGSGITASLTNVLGTFHVQVNVFKLISAITSGNVSSIFSAFNVPANFSLNIGGLNITVPNAVTITASGIQFNYDASFNPNVAPSNPSLGGLHGSDGLYHQKYLTINSGSVSLPEFGVTASIAPDTANNLPGLTIWDNGFTIGTATVSVTGSNGAPFTLGSILSFNNIAVIVTDFDVVFGQAIDFNGSITISTNGATFLPGKPISASITQTPAEMSANPPQPAMSATLQFSGGQVQDVVFMIGGTFSVSISSYVTFTGTGITLDTSAGPNEPIAIIDSIGVKVTLGSLAITGSATDFEFLGNGSFVPLAGFGVVLSVGSSTGSSFMWPSWLPIQITELGIQWPDGITTDPTDMLITLSASITGIQGLGGLTFSGSVQGIQIDTGLLLAGQFPIVGIQSFGVTVTGNMFGGEINATLVGGIVNLDVQRQHDRRRPTRPPRWPRVSSTPGSRAGFPSAGCRASRSRSAFRRLGPLGVQLSVDLPEGILLDPDTGLSSTTSPPESSSSPRCRRSPTRCS